MHPALHGFILALLFAVCERDRLFASLVAESGLTPVEPLRSTGADEADQALLLRLRRGLDRPLKIAGLLRSGDAWLVAYTYDENEAWWREVHREGRAAEVRADLRQRRRECEAAFRSPEEDELAGSDEGAPDDGSFSVEPENAMDDRSCWELAMGSLVPREGPLDGDCDALGVARVTADAVEPLWALEGSCVRELAGYALVDVAGAGWKQLVVQVSDMQWGLTRMGFQEAEHSDRLVVLDPRAGHEPELLEQVLRSEMVVDEAWVFSGSYAHVAFARGRHMTVYVQEWAAAEECQRSDRGWAVEKEAEEEQELADCSVEWKVERRPWDAGKQQWSAEPQILPAPTRPPERALELPLELGKL